MEYSWSFWLVSPFTPSYRYVLLTSCSHLVAADVNIYASHPKHAKPLIGNHENTEIGEFIRDYLDLDLESVTKELKAQPSTLENGKDWLGKLLSDQETQGDLDHYHGDFKRGLACECGSPH